jgi:hypothetical protein
VYAYAAELAAGNKVSHAWMKILFDESLSPKLIQLLRDLFPIVVSTDRDFEHLLSQIPGAKLRHSPFLRLSD